MRTLATRADLDLILDGSTTLRVCIHASTLMRVHADSADDRVTRCVCVCEMGRMTTKRHSGRDTTLPCSLSRWPNLLDPPGATIINDN